MSNRDMLNYQYILLQSYYGFIDKKPYKRQRMFLGLGLLLGLIITVFLTGYQGALIGLVGGVCVIGVTVGVGDSSAST